MPWLDRLLVRGRRGQVLASLTLVAAAVVCRRLVGPEGMVATPVVGLAVVGTLAWIWGARGGALAGLVAIPAGDLLAFDGQQVAPLVGRAEATVSLVLVAVVVGGLRWLVVRLDSELAARREADSRLRRMYERIPVGLFRLSAAKGSLLEVNPAFAAMVGRTPEELTGVSVDDLRADPEHPDEDLAHFAEADVISGRLVSLRRSDGATVWGRFHSVATRDDRGRVVEVEGVVRDVTDLLTSEEQARKAAELFQKIFHSAPIGFVITDPTGHIVTVNPSFAALLGETPERLVDRRWIDLTHPDDRERNLRSQEENTGDAYEIEKRYLRADGSPVWVLVRSSAIRDAGGRIMVRIGQVLDITARREAAEALEGLVKAKDEFVASVSHELRTPLSAVLGLAQELRDSLPEFSHREIQDLVGLIADQSAEVTSIVEDLLVAARADIGKVAVVIDRLDLRAETHAVLEAMPGAGVVVVGGGGPVMALADRVRLRQVVRNLVSNALRYGGSSVRVSFSEEAGTSVLEVTDDGDGIPLELRERIFEPYQRAHAPNGVTASVGLGLTVSRKLAVLMGGDLAYRATPGSSTFRLTLPASPVGEPETPRYHDGSVVAEV